MTLIFRTNYTNWLFIHSKLVIHLRVDLNYSSDALGEVNSHRIMKEAFLLTGGNIGDRLDYLSKAKEAIRKRCGRILKESSVYETAAWGIEDQQAFLNQVLKIETQLNPEELLKTILKIEEELGRERGVKFGPRTVDIDILLFNNDIIDQQGLKVPHPQMQNRRFVLVPLNEIASEKIHPVFKQSISQILAVCADPLAVHKFN